MKNIFMNDLEKKCQHIRMKILLVLLDRKDIN